MDLRSGYPFWPVLDGLLAVWPPVASDERCDVAILGGGISGALIADQVSAAGLDAIVIDQREIGWGATAGSTALLQYDLDHSLEDLIALRGEQAAARCYRACREALDTLDHLITSLDDDVGYRRQRAIYLASRQSDVSRLQREAALRASHGLPAEFRTGQELRAETGVQRPAALVTSHAAQVDPYALTVALLRRTHARGARVYDRTRVTRIQHQGDRLILRTDRGPAVSCGTLVRATGYETELLLKQRDVTLRSTYAFASEPIPGLPRDLPQFWEVARPYLYVRSTPDHRLIVGGEDDAFANPVRRDRALPGKVKHLLRKARKLFPSLAIEPAFYWAGTFAESADSMPFIGPHRRYPRQLFALCYGGNGITFATIAARLLRDRLLGHPSDDEGLFGFGR